MSLLSVSGWPLFFLFPSKSSCLPLISPLSHLLLLGILSLTSLDACSFFSVFFSCVCGSFSLLSPYFVFFFLNVIWCQLVGGPRLLFRPDGLEIFLCWNGYSYSNQFILSPYCSAGTHIVLSRVCQEKANTSHHSFSSIRTAVLLSFTRHRAWEKAVAILSIFSLEIMLSHGWQSYFQGSRSQEGVTGWAIWPCCSDMIMLVGTQRAVQQREVSSFQAVITFHCSLSLQMVSERKRNNNRKKKVSFFPRSCVVTCSAHTYYIGIVKWRLHFLGLVN